MTVLSFYLTELVKLKEGVPYFAQADEYVITENHSLEDVLAHLLIESGNDKEHLINLLNALPMLGFAAPEDVLARYGSSPAPTIYCGFTRTTHQKCVMTTPLSPDVQKAMNAFWDAPILPGPNGDERGIAAFLRSLVASYVQKRQIHPDSLGTEYVIEAEDILRAANELDPGGATS